MKKNAPRSRKKTLPVISLIGIAVMLMMLLQTAILEIISLDNEEGRPAVVFAGNEITVPGAGLRYSLSRAGFDLRTDFGDEVTEDGTKIVIAAYGDGAFDLIARYKDSPDVLGFILIDPSFPGNASLNDMNAASPDKPIAIFCSGPSEYGAADMPDAARLYERLSGDDTVYGTPVRRGGVLSSKVFINNGQNRYLSFEGSVLKGTDMLKSPLLQRELASYLCSAYPDVSGEMSIGAISVWYVFLILGIFGFMAGLMFYLAPLPYYTDEKKEKRKVSVIPSAAAAVILSLGAAALMLFARDKVVIACYTVIAVLITAAVTFLSSLKEAKKAGAKMKIKGREKIIRALFLFLMSVLFVVFVCMVLSAGMTGDRVFLGLLFVCCAADALIQTLRYATYPYLMSVPNMLITCIPFIALSFVAGSLTPVLLYAVPLMFGRIIRSHSDHSFAAGLCHACIMLMIALFFV